jgi:hypothetical protein
MRKLMALVAAGGLLSLTGCLHDTCDCCNDVCSSCHCLGGVYAAPAGHPAPAGPAVKPEEIKKMPAPAPAPEKADKPAGVGE